ncbi:MAG: hypothetical protein JO053_02125 [Acidobacteria bacterium]|nr:hypothetical protein [Acidobacteriota bacterium]
MSEAVSPAEDAYASGLKIWEISMQAGGAKGMLPDAVKYLREAISLGLEPSKEVVCYLTLGLVLFDLYREQFEEISDLGLDNLAGIGEAVAMLERALRLDQEHHTSVFVDRTAQSGVLLRLSAVWFFQGAYIKNTVGPDGKLQYLQQKVELLDYLHVFPPGLCNSLAFYYRDSGNRSSTLEWLKKGAESDVYTDIDGQSSFFLIAKHSRESCQKGVAEMLNPRKGTAEPKEKSGCFIATAVYGSSLTPEVIQFRQFRDNTLLRSVPGSIFVDLYYFLSPPIATVITKLPILKLVVRRVLLEPLLRLIRNRH